MLGMFFLRVILLFWCIGFVASPIVAHSGKPREITIGMVELHADALRTVSPLFYRSDGSPNRHKITKKLIEGSASLVGLSRPVTEVILLYQIFQAAGYPVKLIPIAYPNYKRMLIEVKAGHSFMVGETIWKDSSDQSGLIMTAPVIYQGQFHKGFYVKSERLEEMLPTRDFLMTQIALLPRWQIDVAALRNIGIEPQSTSTMQSVFRMLDVERGDFTLLEFSSRPQFEIEWSGISLKPIPGVKISLPNERCFSVPNDRINAQELVDTMDRGITRLRKDGIITALFTKVGFFNKKVDDWKDLSLEVE